MKTIFIPARYGSTRFPGKPLAEINGPDGSKTLIQRTWETSCDVNVDEIFVLTDNEEIRSHCQEFGAKVLMTSEKPKNGTERCAEALSIVKHSPELVINLQGDAPLTPSWFIEEMIAAYDNGMGSVITPVLKADTKKFLNDRKHGRVGGTTVVCDIFNSALYFSKEIIPYVSDPENPPDILPDILHHVGVYAYSPKYLRNYINLPESKLEKAEGLEQNRFLENGMHIYCVPVDSKGHEFWEVNNPEDIKIVEDILHGKVR